MKPQSFIFMGRYGAGKGTQAKLLMEALKRADPDRKSLHIETGAEFRKFTSESSFTAKHTKSTIDKGFLMPIFMCIFVWGRRLVEDYTGAEHLIFDGTPRKLLEAKALDELFPFYGLEKPWLVYLDVNHDESSKRLSLRATNGGRVDDGAEVIKKRKTEYENDVIPTIEWYKTNPNVNFLDIDGERSIENIHADIVKRVGLV